MTRRYASLAFVVFLKIQGLYQYAVHTQANDISWTVHDDSTSACMWRTVLFVWHNCGGQGTSSTQITKHQLWSQAGGEAELVGKGVRRGKTGT